MLHVYQSNRVERLSEELCEVLRRSPAGPFEETWVAVPGDGMKEWLAKRLADGLGVWANGRLVFPRQLVERVFELGLGEKGRVSRRYDPGNTVWALMALLLDRRGDTRSPQLAAYLSNDPSGLRTYQLASRLARTFDEYTLYRPEMILEWERGGGSSWQAELWRALSNRLEGVHFARAWTEYRGRAARGELRTGAASKLALFGLSTLAPAHLAVLGDLSSVADVHLFLLVPCREYFADVTKGAAAEMGARGGGNLLAANGREARELQDLLLDLPSSRQVAQRDLFVESKESPPSALAKIQTEVLRAGLGGDDGPDAGGARNIRVHSCHGPMREVEVLRDALLDLFERLPGLEPDGVLVMAPEMDVYAPFVEAVFHGEADGWPRIPFRVASPASGEGVEPLATVLRVMKAARGRWTLDEGMELLSRSPVARRFGLDSARIEIALATLEEAGIRWAVDGAHRSRLGQPEEDANTWRFGLSRLMLGYAMGEPGLVGEIASLPPGNADLVEILGRVARFSETCADLFESMAAPMPATSWCSVIREMLQTLFLFSEDEQEGRRRLLDGLDRLEAACAAGGLGSPLQGRIFEGALVETLGRGGGGVPRGAGVTFCDMGAARGVPYDVVCLLGMGDRGFPRGRSAPSFDLIAVEPRPGDRSVRDDDRALFLEAVLAARRCLHISYVGQEQGKEGKRPPSVVVRELQEAVADGDGGAFGEVTHLRTPHHPAYFRGDDSRLFTYSPLAEAGARAARNDERSSAPPYAPDVIVAREEEAKTLVSLDELAEYFGGPASYVLRRRLGVRLPREAEAPQDREPLLLDALERHDIGEALVAEQVNGDDMASSFRRLKAMGKLPLGAAGKVLFEEMWRATRPVAGAVYERFESPGVEERVRVELELPVSGSILGVRGDLGGIFGIRRLVCGYGRLNAKRRIKAWIDHLAWSAAGGTGQERTSVLLGRGSRSPVDEVVLGCVGEDPGGLLGDLVEIYLMGRKRPLRLITDLSYDYARELEKLGDKPDRASTLAKISSAWGAARWVGDGAPRGPGFFAERVLFADGNPVSDDGVEAGMGFTDLASRVFAPLVKAEDGGGR